MTAIDDNITISAQSNGHGEVPDRCDAGSGAGSDARSDIRSSADSGAEGGAESDVRSDTRSGVRSGVQSDVGSGQIGSPAAQNAPVSAFRFYPNFYLFIRRKNYAASETFDSLTDGRNITNQAYLTLFLAKPDL